MQEKSKSLPENFEKSSENNGGRTNYYDLPLPYIEQIVFLLEDYRKGLLKEPEEAARAIFSLFPSTLLDLIEHKNMLFWRGEAFKALYALEERADRSTDGTSSEVRELNKVIYYCNRRLAILERDTQP